ncbi:MAG: M23 family metallopeptidase [Chitinophagaceae bacterium]|nr:M23 family metallopeptidase [Chitinophagaceae bacterium]
MDFKIVTLHKPFLFFYFLIIISITVEAQFAVKKYPQGYFIYPVGATIALAANFGELRPNHYHMGLDCRTEQRVNLPVYAAADGYVAKVRIEPEGFGRAIYINHPNGLTTLYGHLNDFYPELEKYVKQQQYKLESWQVFLDIPPNLFPVKQHQFIANSGNAGASQGPHMHFEIRDTRTDKVLNPLLFGFPIKDDVPPTIVRLAVYDRSISTYSQSPRLLSLKKINGVYIPVTPIINVSSSKVSFAISAFDKISGSANPNGIYQAVLYDNDEAQVGFQLDSITYDETRYLNAHIDYKLRAGGGPFVEHLSRLPGYPQGIYKDFKNDGVIDLSDEALHNIKIEVKDTYGNTSILKFQVKGNSDKKSSGANQQTEFQPGFLNIFDKDDIQVIVGENDLYDSITFLYSKTASATANAISYVHHIHTGLVPVHGFYTIKIKPSVLAANLNSDKIIMERTWGDKTDVVKAKREVDWLTGTFRNFGNVQLLIDNVPPVIAPVGISDGANLSHAAQVIFVVTDNNKAIKNFRAELDGRWLRFTNDKGRSFIYKFDEMCPAGAHELKVSVEDEAGNTVVKQYHFSR